MKSRRSIPSKNRQNLSDPRNFLGRLKIFANFDSIDSIFRSIRSILCPRAMVDRPAGAGEGEEAPAADAPAEGEEDPDAPPPEPSEFKCHKLALCSASGFKDIKTS